MSEWPRSAPPPAPPCPRCGNPRRFAHISCPQCGLQPPGGPLSGAKRVVHVIGLALVVIPLSVAGAFVIGYIGAFIIDIISAGSKIERGGNLGQAEKPVVAGSIVVIAGIATFALYHLLARSEDARLLHGGDYDEEAKAKLWIAIEMAALFGLGSIGIIVMAHR